MTAEREIRNQIQAIAQWLIDSDAFAWLECGREIERRKLECCCAPAQDLETFDPAKRLLCEMPLCIALQYINTVTKGFELCQRNICLANITGEIPHFFFWNKDQNLILCLTPGQFADRIKPASVTFTQRGQRMTFIAQQITGSAIKIIESPDRNCALLGSPEDFKSTLGIDFCVS